MSKYLSAILAAVLAGMALISCGDDNEPQGSTDLLGYWSGVSYYNNPVSGTKKQELYVDFNSDNTGSLEFRGTTQIAFAYFTYKQKKNIISCTGAYASTSGALEGDFEMDFELKDNRLYPRSKYTQFILTQDGSVVTDADGNEIKNNESLLQGVWIREGGYNVIEFYASGTYEEFILEAPGSDNYTSHSRGDYKYDPIAKSLYIGTSGYDINLLTSTTMILKNKISGTVYTFTKGSSDDLPDLTDIRTVLVGGTYWSSDDGKTNYIFASNGSCTCVLRSSKKYGSYGYANMNAKGTFSVSSTGKVTADFTSIFIDPSEAANEFSGWRHGGTKKDVFSVSVLDFQNYKTIKLTYSDNSTVILKAL